MNSVNTEQLDVPSEAPGNPRLRIILLVAFGALLVIAFGNPLWNLFQLAFNSEIQSYILLIPFISLYLFKMAPKQLERPILRSSVAGAWLAGLGGLVALVAYLVLGGTGHVTHNDALTLATSSFLMLLLATALATLGSRALRPRLFAICILAFMIPLPTAALEFITIGLQRASAYVGEVMLRMTGMPVMREGMMMQLPGLRIVVAEECSGIRSTLVLFITGVVASYLFLRTGWKRTVLVSAILPLAILRNAFRIATIAWLTVNVDSRVIHSPLHHRGGPLFFVLSLLPLFLLLWRLRKSEGSMAIR